jgi:hypothetical protein
VQLCVADGERLPFPEDTFDHVYAHGVIQYTADDRTLVFAVSGAVGAATPATQIKACVNKTTKAVRISSNFTSAASCSSNEAFKTWSITGPVGPQGAKGATGAAGSSLGRENTMIRMGYLLGAVVLAILVATGPVLAAEAEKPLNNAEIVKLTKADMGDEIILAKIRSASAVAFSVAAAASR